MSGKPGPPDGCPQVRAPPQPHIRSLFPSSLALLQQQWAPVLKRLLSQGQVASLLRCAQKDSLRALQF